MISTLSLQSWREKRIWYYPCIIQTTELPQCYQTISWHLWQQWKTNIHQWNPESSKTLLPFRLSCSLFVHAQISISVFIHPHLCISTSSLSQSSLTSHVGQSHLRADGKGLPLQVHLHVSSSPEPLPLCQCDCWDRFGPTGTGTPMAAHRGEVKSFFQAGSAVSLLYQ